MLTPSSQILVSYNAMVPDRSLPVSLSTKAPRKYYRPRSDQTMQRTPKRIHPAPASSLPSYPHQGLKLSLHDPAAQPLPISSPPRLPFAVQRPSTKGPAPGCLGYKKHTTPGRFASRSPADHPVPCHIRTTRAPLLAALHPCDQPSVQVVGGCSAFLHSPLVSPTSTHLGRPRSRQHCPAAARVARKAGSSNSCRLLHPPTA